MQHFLRILLLLAIVILPTGARAADDGPGPENTDRALPVRPVENFETWQSEGDEAYARGMAIIRELEEQLATSTPKLTKGIVDQVGEAYLASGDVSWAGEKLTAHGEPAGHDFALRRDDMRSRIAAIVATFKSDSDVAVKFRDTSPLDRLAQKNVRGLEKVTKLARAQKWVQADEEMHETLHRISEPIPWFAGDQVTPRYKTYYDVNETLQKFVREYRNNAATAANRQMWEEVHPNLPQVLDELYQAESAVRSSGGFNGQEGPVWLGSYIARLQDVQLAMINARGLDLAYASPATSQARAAMNEAAAAHQEFYTQLDSSLARFIEACAARVPGEDAARWYAELNRALAELATLSPDPLLSSEIQASLAAYEATFPNLRDEVARYREATSDILRWRERTATAYASAKSGSRDSFDRVLGSSIGTAPRQANLHRSNEAESFARLWGPASLAAAHLTQELVGKSVTTGRTLAARDDSGFVSTAIGNDGFARLQRPADLDSYADELADALGVTAEFGPLTLEVATAVESARRGDLEAASGTVESFQLIGRTTIPAIATPRDWGLYEMTALEAPATVNPIQLRGYVLVETSIRPDWVRHKYFFLPTP